MFYDLFPGDTKSYKVTPNFGNVIFSGTQTVDSYRWFHCNTKKLSLSSFFDNNNLKRRYNMYPYINGCMLIVFNLSCFVYILQDLKFCLVPCRMISQSVIVDAK